MNDQDAKCFALATLLVPPCVGSVWRDKSAGHWQVFEVSASSTISNSLFHLTRIGVTDGPRIGTSMTESMLRKRMVPTGLVVPLW